MFVFLIEVSGETYTGRLQITSGMQIDYVS